VVDGGEKGGLISLGPGNALENPNELFANFCWVLVWRGEEMGGGVGAGGWGGEGWCGEGWCDLDVVSRVFVVWLVVGGRDGGVRDGGVREVW